MLTGAHADGVLRREIFGNQDADAVYSVYGLRQLTHRDIGGDRSFDNPQSQYPSWLKWWNQEGATAPVYRAIDCGEIKPLR